MINHSLLQKRLSYILGQLEKKERMLILWEVDSWHRKAINRLLQKGYEPSMILSFNVGIGINQVWGIKICHPDVVKRLSRDSFILCITEFEYRIHKHYLIYSLNINPSQIYVDYSRPSYFICLIKQAVIHITLKCQMTINTSVRMIKRAQLLISLIWGFRIYKKLRKCFGQTIRFLFVNYPGTGDVYLSNLLLKPYLQKQQIEADYLMIVTGRAGKAVAAMFDHPHLVEVSEAQSEHLRRFIYFVGETRLGVKMLVQLSNQLDISLKFAAIRLNLLEMYIYNVFEYRSIPEMRFPMEQDCVVAVKTLFQSLGLRAGKTVIISPYANSEVGAPLNFWRKVIYFFRSYGWDVATMCHGEERPIQNTPAIDFPFKYANQVLNYAGCFVGARSGFCDLTILARCKKIIFYFENMWIPGQMFYNEVLSHINKKTIYEWASLRKMGIGGSILEIRTNYQFNKRVAQMISQYLGEKNA